MKNKYSCWVIGNLKKHIFWLCTLNKARWTKNISGMKIECYGLHLSLITGHRSPAQLADVYFLNQYLYTHENCQCEDVVGPYKQPLWFCGTILPPIEKFKNSNFPKILIFKIKDLDAAILTWISYAFFKTP